MAALEGRRHASLAAYLREIGDRHDIYVDAILTKVFTVQLAALAALIFIEGPVKVFGGRADQPPTSTELRTFVSALNMSALCQKRTSRATDTIANYRGPFCPTREAITREGAATRTVSVAAAARLPAAFAP